MCGVGIPVMHVGLVPCEVRGADVPIERMVLVSPLCLWGWCPHGVWGVAAPVVPAGSMPPCCTWGLVPAAPVLVWCWAWAGSCGARRLVYGESGEHHCSVWGLCSGGNTGPDARGLRRGWALMPGTQHCPMGTTGCLRDWGSAPLPCSHLSPSPSL